MLPARSCIPRGGLPAPFLIAYFGNHHQDASLVLNNVFYDNGAIGERIPLGVDGSDPDAGAHGRPHGD